MCIAVIRLHLLTADRADLLFYHETAVANAMDALGVNFQKHHRINTLIPLPRSAQK